MVFSQLVSAEETPLVSKELKSLPPAFTKAAAKAAAKKAVDVPKGKKIELPGVDDADEKAEGTTKFLQGSVSAKSNFGVALVYGQDPTKGDLEMWSEYNKSTKLSGYKNFAAIEEGDKVEIRYKQLKKTGKKRILQEIRLVEKKPKEETAPAENSASPAKPVSTLSAVKI